MPRNNQIPRLPPPDQPLLNVPEAAAVAGVAVITIERLLQRGTLQSIKLFGARLIPRFEVERYMAAKTVSRKLAA